MNFQDLLTKMKQIDEGAEVDGSDVVSLAQRLQTGEITYDEFRDQLDRLEFTDNSMRQGEMGMYGGDTPAGHRAWDRDRAEWDDNEEEPEDGFEESLSECGDMPGMMNSPKQQDNVNMNVTMSGNGPGGIKDLMNILKHIESGDDSHSDDAVIIGGDNIADVQAELDDSYDNEPNPEVAGIDAVTATGNDMHSKGDEAEKVNGGGNPWKQTEVSEALIQQLASHYQAVKNS